MFIQTPDTALGNIQLAADLTANPNTVEQTRLAYWGVLLLEK
jgi:hypothetical protein